MDVKFRLDKKLDRGIVIVSRWRVIGLVYYYSCQVVVYWIIY